ncbi:proline-rich protein 15 [Protopterus annectens]|uniref:proline-rich protein 15 n=1 Tax=Protopterus annectens TaxID=7888 RepID=UPI001CFBD634|nr:proline-rich protein 15 [Protopterus annectens]
MADSAKGTWWKSLTIRKKPKEFASYQEGIENQSVPERTASTSVTATAISVEKNPNHIPGDDYVDPRYEKAGFNEKTSRRNLRISRSGRFKEKRRVRASLPEQNQFFEENGNANEELH